LAALGGSQVSNQAAKLAISIACRALEDLQQFQSIEALGQS
jgi:hypothetical protein